MFAIYACNITRSDEEVLLQLANNLLKIGSGIV